MNNERIERLRDRYHHVPRWTIGQLVSTKEHGPGVIDSIYADIEGAEEAGIIPASWIEMQTVRPLSDPAHDFWYGILLFDREDGRPGGAILAGEQDIR